MLTSVHRANAAGRVVHFQVDARGTIVESGPAPAVPALVYLNEREDFDLPFVAQHGDEWAEDIHTVADGDLTGFAAGFAGFQGAEGDSFDVTYTLYSGDATTGPDAVLLGPWTFRVPYNTIGLGISFDPFGISVGPDLWFGVQFSDANVGLVLHDPPQIGTSGDLYWNQALDAAADFGGSPVANFVMSVSSDQPLPVERTSWGGVKTRF